MPKLGTIGLSSFWGSDLLILLTPWMSLTTERRLLLLKSSHL